jgi:hypothetical protein
MSLRLIAANRIDRKLPPHPKITNPPGNAPPGRQAPQAKAA